MQDPSAILFLVPSIIIIILFNLYFNKKTTDEYKYIDIMIDTQYFRHQMDCMAVMIEMIDVLSVLFLVF